MIGLLCRIMIGVAITATAGYTVYTVYKRICRSTIKDEVKNQLDENGIISEALKAKIKEKGNNIIKLDVLSTWDDEPLMEDMEITGDEIDVDIKVGDIIYITD